MPSVLLLLFTIGMSSAYSCKPHQMMCPFGWESWGGSCYKNIEEGQITWQAGRLKCLEIGGEMFAPSSLEENNYMLSKAVLLFGHIWIGCNDIEIEGQWKCTSDSGFMNWYGEEPDGLTDTNCAELIPQSPYVGKWVDHRCSNINQVFCKIKGEEVKLKQWRLLASCLTGHTLREIPTSNVRACAIECDYDPRCHSFNVQHFGTGERICQLNLRIRSEADHTQFVKSKKPFTCIYGEK